jgi:hypothetical protein
MGLIVHWPATWRTISWLTAGWRKNPSTSTIAVFAAADQCLTDHAVDAELIEAFFAVNLAYAASEELRRRITATGYDMAPVDELLRQMQPDPRLDVTNYIDARPELFEKPMNAAMTRAGLNEEMGIQLIGGYIGMRQKLEQDLPLLRGN